MKIAITGHSAGIGQALATAYAGNEIVGLSRRNGYNIRSIPKIADAIEPCDMFINNAQAGYAQTELLIEMCRRWANQDKRIVVISTMMTMMPISTMPGLEMTEYYLQKTALESAVAQLRNQYFKPRITVVRPGYIATQPGQTAPPAANVDNWARTLVDTLNMAQANNLDIPDISLGPLQ